MGGHFGTAMTLLGDINQDGFVGECLGRNFTVSLANFRELKQRVSLKGSLEFFRAIGRTPRPHLW